MLDANSKILSNTSTPITIKTSKTWVLPPRPKPGRKPSQRRPKPANTTTDAKNASSTTSSNTTINNNSTNAFGSPNKVNNTTGNQSIRKSESDSTILLANSNGGICKKSKKKEKKVINTTSIPIPISNASSHPKLAPLAPLTKSNSANTKNQYHIQIQPNVQQKQNSQNNVQLNKTNNDTNINPSKLKQQPVQQVQLASTKQSITPNSTMLNTSSNNNSSSKDAPNWDDESILKDPVKQKILKINEENYYLKLQVIKLVSDLKKLKKQNTSETVEDLGNNNNLSSTPQLTRLSASATPVSEEVVDPIDVSTNQESLQPPKMEASNSQNSINSTKVKESDMEDLILSLIDLNHSAEDNNNNKILQSPTQAKGQQQTQHLQSQQHSQQQQQQQQQLSPSHQQLQQDTKPITVSKPKLQDIPTPISTSVVTEIYDELSIFNNLIINNNSKLRSMTNDISQTAIESEQLSKKRQRDLESEQEYELLKEKKKLETSFDYFETHHSSNHDNDNVSVMLSPPDYEQLTTTKSAATFTSATTTNTTSTNSPMSHMSHDTYTNSSINTSDFGYGFNGYSHSNGGNEHVNAYDNDYYGFGNLDEVELEFDNFINGRLY